MTALWLNLHAHYERKLQLEAVERALWALQHDDIEPAPPEGVSLSRWRGMLKHAAKGDSGREPHPVPSEDSCPANTRDMR